MTKHRCRPMCAACCIAPDISSPIPGMPNGKPAGIRCIQLSEDLLCNLIDSPLRPEVCKNFKFDEIICGKNRDEAMKTIADLLKP